MTEKGEMVQWYPVTSGRINYLHDLAEEYYYSDGRAIRRPARSGLLMNVRYEVSTGTFYRAESAGQGIVGVLPSGHLKYKVPIGTTSVVIEPLSGSPVSGAVSDYRLREGVYPTVHIHVLLSGVHVGMITSREPEPPQKLDSLQPTVHSLESRPARPGRCRNCGSEALGWDGAFGDYVCAICARPQGATSASGRQG